jgi:hypothetical protein
VRAIFPPVRRKLPPSTLPVCCTTLVVHLANHLTRKIGFSLHDQVSDFDYSELESAKLLDADAKALESIAQEVKTTIDDLHNII